MFIYFIVVLSSFFFFFFCAKYCVPMGCYFILNNQCNSLYYEVIFIVMERHGVCHGVGVIL